MNAIAPTLNDRTSFHRPVRIAVVLCLVCVLAFGMMITAYAGTVDTIEAGIKGGMNEAFKLLKAIVTPIAAVVFAIYGLGMLFGGQRGMETGKKGMLICALAIAAVWLAPLAIKTISSWFADVDGSSVFSVTPP